jgi:hypothetical protein
MRNWDTRDESGTDRGCEWEKDWEDVQVVCKKIGIPCELVRFVDLTKVSLKSKPFVRSTFLKITGTESLNRLCISGSVALLRILMCGVTGIYHLYAFCRIINRMIGKSNLAHCWIGWLPKLREMLGLQRVCQTT